MFKFNITLNDHDYLRFNQHHMVNSPSGKRNLKIFQCSIPLLSIFRILQYVGKGVQFQFIQFEVISFIIVSILWIFLSRKILINSTKLLIRMVKIDGKLPYSKESILIFDDNSIQEITSTKDTITKYMALERIDVTEEASYIYTSSIQAYIIPTSEFSGDIVKKRFIEFITSKLKGTTTNP